MTSLRTDRRSGPSRAAPGRAGRLTGPTTRDPQGSPVAALKSRAVKGDASSVPVPNVARSRATRGDA